jgi:flagellar basal-body rod protein FlgB
MPIPLESVTSHALVSALNAASLRHQAISSNIANINVPGYRALDVSFEASWARATQELRMGRPLAAETVGSLTSAITPVGVGGDVAPPALQLDTEVSKLSLNALHYQVLVKGLSKHLSVMQTAVSDGKR